TAIVASFVIAIFCDIGLRTGNADVDVVERFHFIEYGIIALLFYRAWKRRRDLSTFVLAALCGILVGTIDESFQWFIPLRVGEMRDVFMDALATCCGLLFSLGFDPPVRFTAILQRGSLLRIGIFAGITILAFALFFNTVHLGYLITDPEIG